MGGLLSLRGTNNNTVLAGPRYLYALSEGGRLPSVLSKIHPRYHTPYIAIIFQGVVALLLIGMDAWRHSVWPGTFALAESLAILSTMARLATYIGTCLAVPVLRRKLPATPRTIRLPAGALIPIAARGVRALVLSGR